MQTVKSKLANKHENIYVYSKNDKPVYNIVYEKYTDDYVERFRYEDEKGKFMIRSKTEQGDLTLEDEKNIRVKHIDNIFLKVHCRKIGGKLTC